MKCRTSYHFCLKKWGISVGSRKNIGKSEWVGCLSWLTLNYWFSHKIAISVMGVHRINLFVKLISILQYLIISSRTYTSFGSPNKTFTTLVIICGVKNNLLEIGCVLVCFIWLVQTRFMLVWIFHSKYNKSSTICSQAFIYK